MEGMEAVAHNPPALKQQRDRAQKRGFSLIEAAFVLAVVGAVIGGIWVSAAKFYEDYKVNKTVSDMALIVKNIQNLISFRDALAIDGGNIVPITYTLMNAGVFPKDWIDGATVKDPFGEHTTIRSYYGNFFMIQFPKVSRSACIKLVVRISSIGAIAGRLDNMGWSRSSLSNIQVNYPDFGTGVFPISTAQAETACTSSTNNNVYFYYGYTRTN